MSVHFGSDLFPLIGKGRGFSWENPSLRRTKRWKERDRETSRYTLKYSGDLRKTSVASETDLCGEKGSTDSQYDRNLKPYYAVSTEYKMFPRPFGRYTLSLDANFRE